MATKKKSTTTTKKRSGGGGKRKSTSRRRSTVVKMGFGDIAMGVAGAVLATKADEMLSKTIKDPKARTAMIAMGGLFAAGKAPKQFKPLLFGMSIAGGTMLLSEMMPSLAGGNGQSKLGTKSTGALNGRESAAFVKQMRDRAQALRGVGSVITGLDAVGGHPGVITGGLTEQQAFAEVNYFPYGEEFQ